MYDENGNVSNGAVVESDSNPPSTQPQPRMNPSSPTSSDVSCAYYSYTVMTNGYRPNGHTATQQVAHMPMPSHVMNVKDPTWLLVEVCREYQRGQCSRNEQECKFAHPLPHVEIQNGRVITCYDNLKNRCNRGTSSCKYLHPPQHLKDQVLINGRNNYAWKNLLAAQVSQTANLTQIGPNMGLVGHFGGTLSPPSAPLLHSGMTTFNPYAPYDVTAAPVYPNLVMAPPADAYGNVGGALTTVASAHSAVPLFVAENGQKMVNVRMDRPEMCQDGSNKVSTMDKIGLPVFQPVGNSMNGVTALHCAPFVPTFSPFHASYVPITFNGHAPSIPRL